MQKEKQSNQNTKRKKGNSSNSSGSESHDNVNKAKYFRTDDSVSSILNETHSVLYNSDEFNTSVFDEVNKVDTHNPTDYIQETDNNQQNMSSVNTNLNPNLDVCDKLEILIGAVKDLKTSQDNMARMFESKLDKLRTDLMASVDSKVRALRDELSIDIGHETTRTDQLLTTVQSIQRRLDDVEQQNPILNDNGTAIQENRPGRKYNPLDNTDITVTVSGIPFSDGEDLMEKAHDMILALGDSVADSVRISAAARLPSRFNDKPGIVKISFQNTEEKVNVLRNKMKLRQTEKYKNVFIKSSKSRVERLIEMNARAVLRNLPDGRDYRVDASGRIKKRDNQTQRGDAISETHLAGQDEINVTGYTWLGFNRTNIHRNAPKASGGVGILLSNWLLKYFNVSVIDKTFEGILGVKFENTSKDLEFILYSCYLPPENSSRGRDAQSFLAHLLTQIYMHSDCVNILLVGDFNARIGSLSETLNQIDNIPKRIAIDNSINQHGHEFIDFLNEAKFCVLNGRFAENDNFTSISRKGKAVVDYFCVPHDSLSNYDNFKVLPIQSIVDMHKLQPLIGERSKLPDHSVITCHLKLMITDLIDEAQPIDPLFNRTRYRLDRIPGDFMSSELRRLAIDKMDSKLKVVRAGHKSAVKRLLRKTEDDSNLDNEESAELLETLIQKQKTISALDEDIMNSLKEEDIEEEILNADEYKFFLNTKIRQLRKTFANKQTSVNAVIDDSENTLIAASFIKCEPLTTAHLLYGRRVKTIPYPRTEIDNINETYTLTASDISKRAQRLSTLIEHFWNRWKFEYLTSLREFHKKTGDNKINIKVGDVVQVHDDKTRIKWKKAVVEEVVTGNDGLVRSSIIRTNSGRTSRPIVKLYPLEINEVTPSDEYMEETNNDEIPTRTLPLRKASIRAKEIIKSWTH
ncbi:unnamed protein product [Mytilus edulis]|uniref:DUF5641 domain-containing protein n=1 Tax=Mytilus edulis TaxID=6550 RepID=A0A8S3TXL0_MYTED|nr:unnamed protein product [Mytilus edulis]